MTTPMNSRKMMTLKTTSFRALTAVALLTVAGACSTNDILKVDRPDVIDPGKLAGANGAAALYNGAVGEVAYSQGGTFAGFMLMSGLFSDEFRFGGTPPEVREFDLDQIKAENSFAQSIWLNLHRGRRAAERAADAIAAAVAPTDKRVGELRALAGLSTIWIAETYCSGAPMSVDQPAVVYGSNLTTDQMLVDDAVHVGRCDVVIPSAIGLHAHHRPAVAGGKTTHPAALDAHVTFVNASRFELVAQAVKQLLGGPILRAARSGAHQQMTFVAADLGFFDRVHSSDSSAVTTSSSTAALNTISM